MSELSVCRCVHRCFFFAMTSFREAPFFQGSHPRTTRCEMGRPRTEGSSRSPRPSRRCRLGAGPSCAWQLPLPTCRHKYWCERGHRRWPGEGRHPPAPLHSPHPRAGAQCGQTRTAVATRGPPPDALVAAAAAAAAVTHLPTPAVAASWAARMARARAARRDAALCGAAHGMAQLRTAPSGKSQHRRAVGSGAEGGHSTGRGAAGWQTPVPPPPTSAGRLCSGRRVGESAARRRRPPRLRPRPLLERPVALPRQGCLPPPTRVPGPLPRCTGSWPLSRQSDSGLQTPPV